MARSGRSGTPSVESAYPLRAYLRSGLIPQCPLAGAQRTPFQFKPRICHKTLLESGPVLGGQSKFSYRLGDLPHAKLRLHDETVDKVPGFFPSTFLMRREIFSCNPLNILL